MERIERIERRIAELYILLLPMRMFPAWQNMLGALGGCAVQLDFFFHIIGLMLWVIQAKKIHMKSDSYRLFTYFFCVVCIFNIMSVVNSTLHYHTIGTVLGENTFTAILGQIIYWFQYSFILLYNVRVFQLVDLKKIEKIIRCMACFLLAIGYLQIILLLTHSNIIIYINDFLARTSLIVDSEYLFTEGRITLIAAEPAYAGNIIVRLILPLFLANFLKEGISKTVLRDILLWIPIIYYTKSTNAYLLVLAEIFSCFVLLIIKQLRHMPFVFRLKRLSVIIIGGGCFFALPLLVLLQQYTDRLQEFMYYLVYKLTDVSNMSTAWRTIPLVVNYNIFLEYPIWGIGNGNQGFFYWKLFPQSAYELLKNTQTFMKAQNEVTNGMVFIPSILSGYGLVGATLFVVFVAISCYMLYKWRNKVGIWFYYYCIGMIGILVGGLATDFVGYYDAWFILSLPLCIEGISKNEKTNND